MTASFPDRQVIADLTAKMFLEVEAVRFMSDKPFIFTSGWASPVYTDCRRLISFPRVRRTLMEFGASIVMREAGLEVSIFRGALPAASSAALAAQLLGQHTSPTQAAVRAERLLRLQEALNTLDPMDREVLSLRHFEEMSLAETALSLGIQESAAAKRYIRALKRLKAILAAMPGGLDSV